jgi:hypothetical protein
VLPQQLEGDDQDDDDDDDDDSEVQLINNSVE